MTTSTATLKLPICTACASQYDSSVNPTNCKICDDPRQFVPGTGQSWTNLEQLRNNHKNTFHQDAEDARLCSIVTEPKFAIGQRALLLVTEHGNVLWDMVGLIDQETVDFINSKGPLKAIIISHPHYYSTHAEWSAAFPGVPIHISSDDQEWLTRPPLHPTAHQYLDGLQGVARQILPGVTIIKAGGHFPGSLLLHWDSKLFIADTIVTVPSAYTPHPRPRGQTSYAFEWSIPNAIPLDPDSVMRIWNSVKCLEWEVTHGAFLGMDIRGHGATKEERRKEMKTRMIESMQVQVKYAGWKPDQAEILRVEV